MNNKQYVCEHEGSEHFAAPYAEMIEVAQPLVATAFGLVLEIAGDTKQYKNQIKKAAEAAQTRARFDSRREVWVLPYRNHPPASLQALCSLAENPAQGMISTDDQRLKGGYWGDHWRVWGNTKPHKDTFKAAGAYWNGAQWVILSEELPDSIFYGLFGFDHTPSPDDTPDKNPDKTPDKNPDNSADNFDQGMGAESAPPPSSASQAENKFGIEASALPVAKNDLWYGTGALKWYENENVRGWENLPSFSVETPYGAATLTVHEGGFLFVEVEQEPITINGIDYRIQLEMRHRGEGQWHSHVTVDRIYQSESGDWMLCRNRTPTDAARKEASQKLLPLVDGLTKKYFKYCEQADKLADRNLIRRARAKLGNIQHQINCRMAWLDIVEAEQNGTISDEHDRRSLDTIWSWSFK